MNQLPDMGKAAIGTGLFVLALTSNPEGGEVQHAVRMNGRNIGATMLALVADPPTGMVVVETAPRFVASLIASSVSGGGVTTSCTFN